MESSSESNIQKPLVYHPELTLITNINEISSIPNYKEQILCSSCQRLLMQPTKCSKCDKLKCKECLEVCEHKYYYEPYKSDILNKLKFTCKNNCEEIVPYSLVQEHQDHLCQKYQYKETFIHLNNKYQSLKRSNEELRTLNDLLKVKLASLLKAKTEVIIDIKPPQKTSITIAEHDHPLTMNNNIGREWECDKCGTRFGYNGRSYICEECDYDLCLQCLVSFLINPK